MVAGTLLSGSSLATCSDMAMPMPETFGLMLPFAVQHHKERERGREYISIRIGTHNEKHCSFFFCLLTAQAKALPIRKQRTHCVLLRYTASKYVLFIIYIYFCFTYMSLNTFSSCCSIWIIVQFYNSCKNENKE